MTPAVPRISVTHGHHDVYWIHTGTLTAGVVPNLGGRLLSLRAGGRELLWRNRCLLDDDLQPVNGHVPGPSGGTLGDWRNYGGDKTWPAPQGWSSPREWAGPPDPVLDSGPYAVEVASSGDVEIGLSVISEADPRTGLQIARTIAITEDNGFMLRLSALNTTDREVTWALWNVTQLAGGGSVEVGVEQRFTEPVELVTGTGVPSWQRTDGATVIVGPQDVVGKLGFPHASGTLRYRHDGISITWTFPVDDDAPYPDGGSRAEVWLEHPQPKPIACLDGLDPPDRIVECEVLSPSHTLAPGTAMALEVMVSVEVTADADGKL